MKISSINCIQNNNNVYRRKYSEPSIAKAKSKMPVEDKLMFGIQCLGAITTASLINVVLKENNIDLGKQLVNGFKKVFSALK